MLSEREHIEGGPGASTHTGLWGWGGWRGEWVVNGFREVAQEILERRQHLESEDRREGLTLELLLVCSICCLSNCSLKTERRGLDLSG